MDIDSQFLILLNRWGVIIHPFSFSALFVFGAILILIIISILISSAETALFSLSPAEKDKIEDQKTRNDRVINDLIRNPQRLLNALYIIENLVNATLFLLSIYFLYVLFGPTVFPILFIIIVVIGVGLFIMVFCNIIPREYASHHAYELAKVMAIPVYTIERLFRPLTRLLTKTSALSNLKLRRHKHSIAIKDLSDALEIEAPSLSDERKILKGIVKFGNTDVVGIMKSRIDVFAVDIDTAFPQLIDVIIESGYSRIPIYEDNLDNIKGILYVKDLFPLLKNVSSSQWQSLIRPPYYVPESKKINTLLKEFQTNKIHMAIIIDEYGGCTGIVTLEDILEEIVGEITDEFDEEEKMYTKLDDRNYLFDGKILLNDVYKILNIPDNTFDQIKGDADSLAGIILEIKGDIPVKNETLTYGPYTFKIEALDNRRIRLIRMSVKDT